MVLNEKYKEGLEYGLEQDMQQKTIIVHIMGLTKEEVNKLYKRSIMYPMNRRLDYEMIKKESVRFFL